MYSKEKMLSLAPIETEIVFCKLIGEQKTIAVKSPYRTIGVNRGTNVDSYFFTYAPMHLKNYFLVTVPELLSDLFTSVAPPM